MPENADPDANELVELIDLVERLEAQGIVDRRAIARLVEQHESDLDLIAALRDSAIGERDAMSMLQLQHEVDQAMVAELQADGLVDREKIANLEIALSTARRIGAAVGIVMALEKVTEDVAFQRLIAASQNTNRKLRDVAEEVLTVGQSLVPR
jgi:hypothetical protein